MRLILPSLMAVAGALTACSHPDAGSASGPVPASTATGEAVATTASRPKAAPVPSVTAAEQPFDAYQAPDHDAVRWMGLCAAAMGSPADAKAVAEQTDGAYQAATDAFAKRDALAAVEARLERATAEGKANPYVRVPVVLTRMPDYDLDHGRYPLAPLVGEGQGLRITEGNARVTYAGNPGLAFYAPSEPDARALEHTLSTNPLTRRVDMTVYGKVTGCALMSGSPALTVTPTRIVLANHYVDGHTTPLLTATTAP